MRRIVSKFGLAAFLVASVISTDLSAQSNPRGPLLQRARAVFDQYMLVEFELAGLAKIQKDVFPASWNRLRERFAETAVDKLQGKVTPEEAQRRYRAMIQESFADVEKTISADLDSLGRAPHAALVAWETALSAHLARHLAIDPSGCDLKIVQRRPASPADVAGKLELVKASWSAFGQGKTAPVDREFRQLRPDDLGALGEALTRSGASPSDKEAVLSGKPLTCTGRMAVSKALLSMTGDAQDRLLAHTITQPLE